MTRRFFFALIGAAILSGCKINVRQHTAAVQDQTVAIQVLALNDFHGNLLPNPLDVADPAHPGQTQKVLAGGAHRLYRELQAQRAKNPNTITVAAGDMIGASPLLSGLLNDDPAIETLNYLKLDASSLGNHELDFGLAGALRAQKGGCGDRGCKFRAAFNGANYTYLAANLLDGKTGQRIFPAYKIMSVGGIKIALIGEILQGTPEVVQKEKISGLKFAEEASTANALVPEIRAQGVETILLLIHQGGYPNNVDAATCNGVTGDIMRIMDQLDPAIDAVISGHSHLAYACKYKGRPLSQALSYGRLLTALDLQIDKKTGDVSSSAVRNIELIDDGVTDSDPVLSEIITVAQTQTKAISDRVIGSTANVQISKAEKDSMESPLGRLIADAQLEYASSHGDAQIAFMNAGGVRADLPPIPRTDKTVTFGDLYTVHPFGNTMMIISLSGAQIKQMLEAQFNPGAGKLSPSKGFTYSYDRERPEGQRIVLMQLNGQDILPGKNYRVAMNQFMADGGDGFGILKTVTDRVNSVLERDMLEAYFKAHSPVSAPMEKRGVAVEK
jgi:5'-nucleotidase